MFNQLLKNIQNKYTTMKQENDNLDTLLNQKTII